MKPKSNPSQKSQIFRNFQWEHQLPSHVVPKSLGISSCSQNPTCRVHFPLQLLYWQNFKLCGEIWRKSQSKFIKNSVYNWIQVFSLYFHLVSSYSSKSLEIWEKLPTWNFYSIVSYIFPMLTKFCVQYKL